MRRAGRLSRIARRPSAKAPHLAARRRNARRAHALPTTKRSGGGTSSTWTGEQAPPPLPPPPVSAEMLRISGRGNCKEAISSPGGKLPCEEIAANPAYTPPGSIEAREGLQALSRSLRGSNAAQPQSRYQPRACRAAASPRRLQNNGAYPPQSPLSTPRPPRSGQPQPPPPHSGAAAFQGVKENPRRA